MYPLSVALVIGTKELWDALQPCVGEVRVLLEQAEVSDWRAFGDKVQRMAPDIVLLDLATVRQPLDEVVRHIRSGPVQPAIFGLHQTLDPELILTAFRSGINEFLHPPLTDRLRAAFEKVVTARDQATQRSKPGGKVIGFVSAKGGCGATTLACHVAVELASATNQKTLLADLDLSSGLVSFLMKSKSRYTVADAASNLQRLDVSFWQGIISNGIPGLELITAPATPGTRSVDPTHLRHVITFARSQYDWLILDLGRSVDQALLTLLEAVDETCVVTTMDVPALHQAKSLIQVLRDSGYRSERLRLILNRTPKRLEVTDAELESLLSIRVDTALPDDPETLNDAYADGKLAAPGSNIGRHFTRLAKKIAGVEDGPKKKFSLFNL